jgi:hypothetical protein
MNAVQVIEVLLAARLPRDQMLVKVDELGFRVVPEEGIEAAMDSLYEVFRYRWSMPSAEEFLYEFNQLGYQLVQKE